MRISFLLTVSVIAAHLAFGGIHGVSYPSKLAKKSVPVKVYTPPGYDRGDERYPVVYNLHGGNGSPAIQWERTRKTLTDAIEGGKVRPMIYVFAEGFGNTLFLDYANGSIMAESSIVKELIPYIDSHYRTIGSHEGRAIEGFSMGGFGALKTAFRYPTLFSSVVSYGGAMLIPEMIEVGAPNSQFPSKKYFDENTPWGLAEPNKDRIIEHLKIRLVAGDQDEKWFKGSVGLKARLDELKIKTDWVPVAGVAHDTKGLYDRAGLESLEFIEKGFAPKLSRREGRAQDRWYYSELNHRDVIVKVYTPPEYDSGNARYAVVYNLHGAGGGSPERQWERARGTLKDAIENGKVRPMIYVFVDGLGDSFFIDYYDGSIKAESMIIQELIPFIDANYRTVASREGRAIDGFSMGGAGALTLAIKHPDLFSSVVSYGAALVMRDTSKPGPRYVTKEYLEQNSPWTMVEKNAAAIRAKLRIRMVCGDQDRLLQVNTEFRDKLKELNIPVEWVAVPGLAHDTRGLYVRVGLDSLKFIQTSLPK
jgi:endo-1,4-beta-xylanase